MAQKNKSKQGKRAPAYSADSLAVHLLLGLILIALGLLIVFAVMFQIPGDVFAGVRQVCRGLAGSLAFLMPVIPIWGGVLVILSTQRKPAVLPFVMACIVYLLLQAAAVLMSYSGAPAVPLMEYILQVNRTRSATPGAYDAFLARAYEMGVNTGMGGGLIGMLLAWPLWKLVGVIPGLILSVLLAVPSAMLMLGLTPARIQELMHKYQQMRRSRDDKRQKEQYEQELAWQRQQALAAQQYQAQSTAAAQQPQQAQPQWYPPQQELAWQPQAPQRQPAPYEQPIFPSEQRQAAYAVPAQPPMMDPDPLPSQTLDDGPTSVYARPEQPKKKARKPSAKADVTQPAAKPRRTSIFGGQSDAQEPVQDSGRMRRTSIFGGKDVPQEPEQPAAKPRKSGIFAAQEEYTEPAAQPSGIFGRNSRKNQPAAHDYDEPATPSRAASWRSGDEEPTYEPALRKPQRTSVAPKAEPVSKPAAAAVTPPASGSKAPQKPLDSWADIPPWEEDPDAPVTPETVVTPVLQHAQPSNAWKPELKIPPRREQPAAPEQTEMDLPTPYVYPSMNLLKHPEPQTGISPEEDAIRSQRLEETLQSFRVPAKVRHITHGPAISRFELELAAGIKVSKVTDLNRNIAMNMEVKSVRIEAPIPGKSLVGVEVPNPKTATVTLREVLESEAMMNSHKPLLVALGKDIAGTPIVCDLARMPHLLIAGATGSGKSVCINTIINSLLFRRSPQEVRLILVDPKVVELKCYDGIPHLLIPVVSDPHKASGALSWAVGEMMDRYKKFEHKGVRAIDSYNEALEDGEEFMPRIVIIIDELADLMMTCKKEVEEHICRLAQLARAAGIHLIVATQRPSVDVITGLIKANIPSRIAFKVSSAVDSRTILDKIGAEHLLGYGDMLYQPTGEFTPIRVQGCFMTDAEVNRVTDFIRETCPAAYDANVLEQLDELAREAAAPAPSSEPVDMGMSDGNLLLQCVEMAVNDGQVSTSLIQRRLKLGYARAGRLVDEMEKRGIVSAKDGAKPRMCLISRDEFEELKAAGAFGDD